MAHMFKNLNSVQLVQAIYVYAITPEDKFSWQSQLRSLNSILRARESCNISTLQALNRKLQ